MKVNAKFLLVIGLMFSCNGLFGALAVMDLVSAEFGKNSSQYGIGMIMEGESVAFEGEALYEDFFKGGNCFSRPNRNCETKKLPDVIFVRTRAWSEGHAESTSTWTEQNGIVIEVVIRRDKNGKVEVVRNVITDQNNPKVLAYIKNTICGMYSNRREFCCLCNYSIEHPINYLISEIGSLHDDDAIIFLRDKNLNIQDSVLFNMTPLIAAIVATMGDGDYPLLEYMLSRPDINVNLAMHKGITPLHFAVWHDETRDSDLNLIRMFLNTPGIDVGVKTIHGHTAEDIARILGDKECEQLLKDAAEKQKSVKKKK